MYRDIKPENVGFDIRGDVKIFDFGLCRGLSESLRAKDDSTGLPVYGYNLGARTGSLPYFAPEVCECRPYDSKCDVFSFGILSWEIFTLQTAFPGITHAQYLHRVALNGERPRIPKRLKPLIKLMLQEAWEYDPQKRPNMRRVATMIRGDLNELSAGDDAVIHRTEHMENRSRHSFQVRQQKQQLQDDPQSATVRSSSHGNW